MLGWSLLGQSGVPHRKPLGGADYEAPCSRSWCTMNMQQFCSYVRQDEIEPMNDTSNSAPPSEIRPGDFHQRSEPLRTSSPVARASLPCK
jgi:hypothetical protein